MTAAEQTTTRPAGWTILPLAHPDAKLLIGLDWRRILDSALGPAVQRQVQQGGHPLLGFLESIENLDRMLVSSPGGEDGGRAPLLVVGEGHFVIAKIRAMAKSDGAISKRYNDVELLVPPNAGKMDLHFALLDDKTILFGDGTSVKQAIDRWQRGDTPQERNQAFTRAQTLSMTQHAWAVVLEPGESLSSLGMAGSTLAEQTESLELGMSFTQTLNATLWVRAHSEEAARTLSTGLPAILQLAAITYSNQPSLAQMAKRVKVVTEQKYLKMGFSLDSRLMEQSLNELRAAAQPKPEPARQARLETPTSAQLEPSMAIAPVRKVIRIVGMDDGVKEIPYQVQSAAVVSGQPPSQ